MAQGRIDQPTVPAALSNHDKRIRALEATPSGSLCCSLPPWEDWSDLFVLNVSTPGGGAPPSFDVIYALMMVQTENGQSWFPADSADAPPPLDYGTVHGIARIEFTGSGTPVTDHQTRILVPLGLQSSPPSEDRSFIPVLASNAYEERHVELGYGTIAQESVTNGPRFGVKVMLNGQMAVDNTPDPFCDPSDEAYYVRVTNPSMDDPGYPFPIAAGDSLTYAFTYSAIHFLG